MDLRRYDLNLLVALNALLEDRQVTSAAKRLGLTQPATSKALARLRIMFKDPLLTKIGRDLVPTPRAIALAPELQRLLRDTSDIIQRVEFDPAGAIGNIRFASTDAVTESVLTPWIREAQRHAPNLTYEVVSLGPKIQTALAKGEIDFAVDVYPEPILDCHVQPLISDRFVCVVRKGNPLVAKKLTANKFESLSHIQLADTGGGGPLLESELARVGVVRKIVMRLPSMTTAAYVVSQTDWSATLPSVRARTSARRFPLAIHELPYELRTIPLCVVWHKRIQTSPLHTWLRGRLEVSVAAGRGLLVPAG